MDDLPTTAASKPEADAPQGLSRRDFLMAAALLGGGAVLMLSRCRPPFPDEDAIPLTIPPDFKRFILVLPSPDVPGEKLVEALGSQCPDLQCALWWVDTREFEFFDRVEDILDRYAQQGARELIWLD